ncbi:hypothetical protein GUI37_01540 [Helcococcus kunzii]|uniref:hypothetical protein n=1 Tax=Helcococcus kunzii TaxID=40091 RepID=UPI001BB067EF|nr:hypothetical protein [Helcococcus kunzii]QUY64269.1 hypothetical protein GUI37_01540 [Helcococcus kunzii]
MNEFNKNNKNECKYCGKYSFCLDDLSKKETESSIWINDCMLKINNKNEYINIPISYCPICGRKL